MNHKISSQVIHFWNSVHWYVEQEYPDYFKYFIPENALPWNNKSEDERKKGNDEFNKHWDMVYSYYLGGNGAEDTAGFMVEYFKGRK